MHRARDTVIQWVGAVGGGGGIVACTPVVKPVQSTRQSHIRRQFPRHLGLQDKAWQGVAADAVAEVFVVDEEGGTVDVQEDVVAVLGVEMAYRTYKPNKSYKSYKFVFHFFRASMMASSMAVLRRSRARMVPSGAMSMICGMLLTP